MSSFVSTSLAQFSLGDSFLLCVLFVPFSYLSIWRCPNLPIYLLMDI